MQLFETFSKRKSKSHLINRETKSEMVQQAQNPKDKYYNKIHSKVSNAHLSKMNFANKYYGGKLSTIKNLKELIAILMKENRNLNMIKQQVLEVSRYLEYENQIKVILRFQEALKVDQAELEERLIDLKNELADLELRGSTLDLQVLWHYDQMSFLKIDNGSNDSSIDIYKNKLVID